MKKNIFLIPATLLAVMLFNLSQYAAGDPNIDRLKDAARKHYWGIGVPKDFSKALSLYLKASELGDSEARYIAGGMYFKGLGTPRDFNKAFSLLYGAAQEGSSTPESQKLLGEFFLTGTGTPKNLQEAMKWYQMAAENGDRDSQSELAFLYFTGRGGERDVKKAFKWYTEAAYQGLAVAQYSLGIMYYSGSGIPKVDLVKAYGWLSMAAIQNYPNAASARDYIDTLFSQDERNAAQDYSLELFNRIQR